MQLDVPGLLQLLKELVSVVLFGREDPGEGLPQVLVHCQVEDRLEKLVLVEQEDEDSDPKLEDGRTIGLHSLQFGLKTSRRRRRSSGDIRTN